MRIALLSDSHGAIDGRIAARALRCDIVVHAGDLCDPAVLRALQGAARRLVAVRGNNDRDAAFAGLPDSVQLELPGGVLAVIHGHQFPAAASRHARLRARFPQARLVLYGHSHRRVLDRDVRPWVVNPGACGLRRTFGGASCLILRAGPRRWAIEVVAGAP